MEILLEALKGSAIGAVLGVALVAAIVAISGLWDDLLSEEEVEKRQDGNAIFCKLIAEGKLLVEKTSLPEEDDNWEL